MRSKPLSLKIYDYKRKNRNPKSPIFYAILFVVVFIVIYVQSINSNSGLHHFDLMKSHEALEDQTDARIELSTSDHIGEINPQLSLQENEEVEEEEDDDSDTHIELSTSGHSGEINTQLSLQENEEVEVEEEEEEEEDSDTHIELSTRDYIGDNDSQLPLQKNVEVEEEDSDENYDPLIPPENASREVRMAWFRQQLPKLEVLQSTSLTQQFHGKITNILNKGCSVLFHIIWFSPAKSFGKREFLTLDTFFKSHPEGCMLIISRSMDSDRGYAILKPLIDRGFKVSAITPDIPLLVKDTPAELWLEQIKSGRKDPGDIPLSQNLSNLVRLAMLYKYGGGYMDTDVIVLKDFSELRNVIGAQSVDSSTKQWNRLNNAVMIFDINHPIMWEFLQEFTSTFNGNKWGNNGPYLVSRVMGRIGNLQDYNITILPPKAFYPVDWVAIRKLYKKPEDESESRWVENQLNDLSKGESYAVHLWNKRSKDLDIEEGSVMARLISDHCVVCADMAIS